jgi:hypothetical protein
VSLAESLDFEEMEGVIARDRDQAALFIPALIKLDSEVSYVEEPGRTDTLDAVLELDLNVDVIVIDAVRGDPLERTEWYHRLHAAMRGEVFWLDDLGLAVVTPAPGAAAAHRPHSVLESEQDVGEGEEFCGCDSS